MLAKYLVADGQKEAASQKLRHYITREWYITDRAELYNYLGQLLSDDDHVDEGEVYISIAYKLQEVNLYNLHQDFVRERNKDQAEKFQLRIQKHKETINKKLKGLPITLVEFVQNYPVVKFNELDFRHKFEEILHSCE